MGMPKDKNRPPATAELRRQAEVQLRAKSAEIPPPGSTQDHQRLVHELEVHQIELEMQNEDLCQLKDQVEKSLAKYTDLFDFAPVGYCTLNRDETIQDSNFTAADLLGIERSRLIGRHFGLFVAPEFRLLFAEFFSRVLAAQSKETCDVKLLHEGPVPCYVRLTARTGNSGQEVRLAVFDISGRKRAEEKFHATRMRLAWVLEKTRIGMWLNELPLNRMTGDAQTRCLFFIEPESEASIDLFWSRLHPDDREPTRLAIKKAIRDHTLYEIEHRAVHPATGETRWIYSAGQATYAADGTPTHFDGINYDISDRKCAEEALREVEDLNNRTLQALPAHIAVVDRQGCIIAVNQAWTDFADNNQVVTAQSVAVGVNYLTVCQQAADHSDADAERALHGIEAVLDGTCEKFAVEYPCHTPEQQQWFLMTAVPLSGGRGGAVITHTDITTRKQAEEVLQKAHDVLEIKVRERTAELTQEIEEHKKAEIALKDAFLEIKRLKEQFEAENIYLQQEVGRQYNFGEIIGRSPLLLQVLSQVEQVAPMHATALLLGETGTGKGMVARAIHSRSSRKGRPLITVNCTTLPAALVESELFGRERGAFTGAGERQIGRFELADGGTIFLDEIGEMPLELQSKLLRVIQDGEFERLGNPRTIKTDVRIIAATNRDLKEEVKNGRFREDLYYRLNVFPISLPPLRTRREDIPLLVNYLVDKFNHKMGRKIETISKDTLEMLCGYHWPGNIRELENVIERAVITSSGGALQILDRLDTHQLMAVSEEKEIKALGDLEHDHILHTLKKTAWRIEGKNGAAQLLGLNASTLRARMRKYGIARRDDKPV